MATKDEIYVSIDLDHYKKNKADILASQVDLINSVKHLKNLNKIIHQEKNLKIRLKELFSSVKENLEALEDSIPTAKLPKSIREKSTPINLTEEFEPEAQESILEKNRQEKQSPIDMELAEIQEKLNQLNA
jgi:hypothetical protein